MTVDDALLLVKYELEAATEKFGSFASQHEGIAVIEEEFLEMREAVFWPKHGGDVKLNPFEEAVQVAAMAVRFLVDLHTEEPR